MAVTHESQKLKRAPNSENDTYDRMRQEILEGHLLPSERLIEMDLAERYGIGRAGVRTVLARLEQEGLVEHEPNRGARVRVISETEAVEILEARAVLEGMAARHAAANITQDDITQLRAVEQRMQERFSTGDLLGISELNSQLHAHILRVANHKTALRLLERLHPHLVRYQYRTILVSGRALHSLAEHHTIIEALAAHDADAAETAMRTHLSHVVEALRQSVRNRRS